MAEAFAHNPPNIVDILSEGRIYLPDNSSEPLKVLEQSLRETDLLEYIFKLYYILFQLILFIYLTRNI